MAPRCVRIRIAGAVLAFMCVSGCEDSLSGPCVLPECPGNELASDVPCADGEPEAECHVLDGGLCGGEVTCRPDTVDGE